MARRQRRRAPSPPERLILDAGAVIALATGQWRARAFLKRAAALGTHVLVPAVVVAETVRGDGARDAPVNRVLKGVEAILPVDESIARTAGRLLGTTGSDATIDAIVVAATLRVGGGKILTGDFEDFRRLSHGLDGIVIYRV